MLICNGWKINISCRELVANDGKYDTFKPPISEPHYRHYVLLLLLFSAFYCIFSIRKLVTVAPENAYNIYLVQFPRC